MYLTLCTIVFCLISSSKSYTGYNLFQGFENKNFIEDKEDTNVNTEDNFLRKETNTTKDDKLISKNTLEDKPVVNATDFYLDLIKNSVEDDENMKYNKMVCDEDETPVNIGPYEVPSQRDLVLLYRNSIIKMFEQYHRAILNFLRDIKEAMKATTDIERACTDIERAKFRKCVRRVSNQYQQMTKMQVITMEKQRHNLKPLIKGQICNITEVKENPAQLLRALAIEKISLDFALPGYLRLLHECTKICYLKPQPSMNKKYTQKPAHYYFSPDPNFLNYLEQKKLSVWTI